MGRFLMTCVAHKTPAMERVYNKCTYCNKYSSFGFPGTGRVCCATHKQQGMISFNKPAPRIMRTGYSPIFPTGPVPPSPLHAISYIMN